MSPNDEGTGQMKQGHIIVYVLLPANEDSTKPVHPRMGALTDPAAGPIPGDALGLIDFLSPTLDVVGKPPKADQRANIRIIIATALTQ